MSAKKLIRRTLLVGGGATALGVGGYKAATVIGTSGAALDDSAQSFPRRAQLRHP